jgi:hypothetical protein
MCIFIFMSCHNPFACFSYWSHNHLRIIIHIHMHTTSFVLALTLACLHLSYMRYKHIYLINMSNYITNSYYMPTMHTFAYIISYPLHIATNMSHLTFKHIYLHSCVYISIHFPSFRHHKLCIFIDNGIQHTLGVIHTTY